MVSLQPARSTDGRHARCRAALYYSLTDRPVSVFLRAPASLSRPGGRTGLAGGRRTRRSSGSSLSTSIVAQVEERLRCGRARWRQSVRRRCGSARGQDATVRAIRLPSQVGRRHAPAVVCGVVRCCPPSSEKMNAGGSDPTGRSDGGTPARATNLQFGSTRGGRDEHEVASYGLPADFTPRGGATSRPARPCETPRAVEARVRDGSPHGKRLERRHQDHAQQDDGD